MNNRDTMELSVCRLEVILNLQTDVETDSTQPAGRVEVAMVGADKFGMPEDVRVSAGMRTFISVDLFQ